MDTELILNRLSRLTKRYAIPAWGIAIYREQNEICRHVEGFRDYEKKESASDGDFYWIYSLTKLSTCTAAMQLIERGKLGLNDLVADYLPAFANLRVLEHGGLRQARTPLRVIDLMTMRGGFDYDIEGLSGRHGAKAGNAALISAIAEKPLGFDPGTKFQYSLCHDVLAGVIAAASGKAYENWLTDEVFMPLGMRETRFAASADELSPFSAQYIYQNGAIMPVSRSNPYVFSPQYRSGGAGLASTLRDYILLVNALSNGGLGAAGRRILQESSVREMAVNRLDHVQIRDFNQWRFGYGYGLGVRTRLQDSSNPRGIVEFGWDGAAGSYALADLTNHVAVLYMQHVRNCSPAFDIIHPALRDAVVEAL